MSIRNFSKLVEQFNASEDRAELLIDIIEAACAGDAWYLSEGIEAAKPEKFTSSGFKAGTTNATAEFSVDTKSGPLKYTAIFARYRTGAYEFTFREGYEFCHGSRRSRWRIQGLEDHCRDREEVHHNGEARSTHVQFR